MDVKTTRLKGWLHSFKVFPYNLLTKKGKSVFTVWKSGGYHVNQVINVFMTNNGKKGS